jgi:hypothetical protein
MRLGLRKDVFVMDDTKHIPSKGTAARACLDEILSHASTPKFHSRVWTQYRVDCFGSSHLIEVLRISGRYRGHFAYHALPGSEFYSDPHRRTPCHGRDFQASGLRIPRIFDQGGKGPVHRLYPSAARLTWR